MNSKQSFLKIVILILLVSVFVLVQYQPGSSQATVWSTPIRLSKDGKFSWFPELAVDQTGRVHVVWAGGAFEGIGQAFDVVYYRSSDNGQDWTDIKDIVALPSKGAVTRPYILIDDEGLLHFTYRDYTVYYSNVPVDAIDPANMLPPFMLSLPDNGYYSQLVMDSANRLHALHTENIQSSCTGCFHIYYRQSLDRGDTWSDPVDITPLPTGAAKPKMLVDSNNTIHVVWESGRGGDLGQVPNPAVAMYTHSEDLGKTWSPPKQFPAPRNEARNIAIGLDGSGNLMVAYLARATNKIYFQISSDGGNSWSNPTPIPGVVGLIDIFDTPLDTYSMATDSAGKIHLVLVGQLADETFTPFFKTGSQVTATASLTPTLIPTSPGTPQPSITPTEHFLLAPQAPKPPVSVLHFIWDGTQWSAPETISTLVGDMPEWPRIAVGLGNHLHVTWDVRDEANIWNTDGGNYQVWYSNAMTDAPAIEPKALPTVKPRMLQTPTETPTEVTVLPATEIAQVVAATMVPGENSMLVYKEMDYMMIMGISLAPALIVIFLVIIIVRKLKS